MERDTPGTAATPVCVSRDSVLAHDRSWAWRCIPKNASRSMMRTLSPTRGLRIAEIEDGAALADRAPFRFAVVRDPLARLTSAWKNKVFAPPPTEGQRLLLARHPEIRVGMCFADFVAVVEALAAAGRLRDVHFRPQVDFVRSQDGRTCVDAILRIEHLAAELAAIDERIGGPIKIPITNASRVEDPQDVTDALRARVRELYQSDYEGLGYA